VAVRTHRSWCGVTARWRAQIAGLTEVKAKIRLRFYPRKRDMIIEVARLFQLTQNAKTCSVRQLEGSVTTKDVVRDGERPWSNVCRVSVCVYLRVCA
jgi:hypothetical protein